MPPRAPTTVLDALHAQVGQHPDGLAIDQIAEMNKEIPRRTLQRHLARLVEMGRLEAVGQASARRYHPSAPPNRVEPLGPVHTPPRPAWQTPEGAEVERLVNSPLSQRRPVGYRREMLERYRPNRTAYLLEVLRGRLHGLGRSPEGERPAGTYARQILGRLLIDLSWASSRLEGNTYTRVDTENLIEFGQLAGGRDQREAQMILNHKAAIEMLVEDVEAIEFNRYTLLNLHAILSDNLLADLGAGGRLRTIPVNISGTSYQPTGVPQVIEECLDMFLAKASAIEDPFEQAFFAMVHVPYLQPFEDVNKCVSRIAANIPLFKHNLAPLSFVDIPMQSYVDAVLGVYELARVDLLRDLFAWAYERSCQRYTVIKDALPQPDPLRLRYRAVLVEMVRETVKAGDSIDASTLRERGRSLMDEVDLDTVVAMAINELHHLHEGNVARFGLRLSEFRTWASRMA